MKNIWFVIPAYNEDEVIEDTAKKLLEKVNNLINDNKLSSESRILFVDDGSIDNSWDIIENLHNQNEIFKGLKLAKNVGQQNALFAGYQYANGKCDAVISLDVDLQDDISILDEAIEKYEVEGFELVLITHNDRKTDTFLKSFTANAFYNFMDFLGAQVVKNHSEYRLMDKVILERLLQNKDSSLFLRGFVPKLTNKGCILEAERKERLFGEPKYNFFSSMNLALNGITLLSIKPIRIIMLIGLLVAFASLFADTMELFSIWFLGGLQILFIGLIGEYVAKMSVYSESKPKYFIEKEV